MGIQYLNSQSYYMHNRRKEKAEVFHVRAFPSLALVLAGSMDWLTTIIGLTYFGAIEANPFIANIASQSLPLFTGIKLCTTFIVGLLFYQANKSLQQTQDKTSKSFKWTKYILKTAYVAATAMLLVAVVNNLIILINSI